MRSVFFVFLAGVGHDFRILARNWQCNRPGLGEKFWILECDRPFDAVTVHFLKALNEMKLVAVFVACRVEPRAVVYPHSVHNESISVPFANGISKPSRIHILGVTASIHIDNSERALVLKKDGNHGRRLDDLERHQACLNSSGGTDRQTLG